MANALTDFFKGFTMSEEEIAASNKAERLAEAKKVLAESKGEMVAEKAADSANLGSGKAMVAKAGLQAAGIKGDSTVGGAASGAITGAQIGGPAGAVVGGVIGGLQGAAKARAKRKREAEQARQLAESKKAGALQMAEQKRGDRIQSALAGLAQSLRGTIGSL